MKKSEESDVPSFFAQVQAKHPWQITHSKVENLPSPLFATNFANIISSHYHIWGTGS